MLYEERKSRYKNLKNFNTVLQRCPRFWPLAPPRGMNPGVYSLGISEDPPRYLSSKFDASVRSDCWDISIWKTLTQCDGNGNANANANVDDRGDYNSSPCTSYRRAKKRDERTDGRTDGRTDEQPRSNMPLQLLWSWGHKNNRDSGIILAPDFCKRKNPIWKKQWEIFKFCEIFFRSLGQTERVVFFVFFFFFVKARFFFFFFFFVKARLCIRIVYISIIIAYFVMYSKSG